MSFMDHLEPKAHKRLEELAEELTVPDGDLLIERGAHGGDFYRVIRGCLEVVDASSVPMLVLDVLGPGTVVGEMGYLSGEPRSADVRAGDGTKRRRRIGLKGALVESRDDRQIEHIALSRLGEGLAAGDLWAAVPSEARLR